MTLACQLLAKQLPGPKLTSVAAASQMFVSVHTQMSFHDYIVEQTPICACKRKHVVTSLTSAADGKADELPPSCLTALKLCKCIAGSPLPIVLLPRVVCRMSCTDIGKYVYIGCPTTNAILGASSPEAYLKSIGMCDKKLTVCSYCNIDVEATNTHLEQLPAHH